MGEVKCIVRALKKREKRAREQSYVQNVGGSLSAAAPSGISEKARALDSTWNINSTFIETPS